MPMTFNTLLREADISPDDVRLLRHKDKRAKKGCTPYELWRDIPPKFDLYQSHQKIENRKRLAAKYWASFLGLPTAETLFVGLYRVGNRSLLEQDTPWPHGDGIDKAGTCDVYALTLDQALGGFVGKLVIKWTGQEINWIQPSANRWEKPILELRLAFKEDPFPGFLDLQVPFSQVKTMPPGWKDAVRSARGIYLLTCPTSGRLYVGAALGQNGFLGRWLTYAADRHGGNKELKENPADYVISVLEVAGTAASERDILAMEVRWMKKFGTKAFGLNH
jgi:hypothetical protein